MLGARDKSSSHGFSHSLAMEEEHTIDLKKLAQHLQHLRLYEDHMSMENLMEGINK